VSLGGRTVGHLGGTLIGRGSRVTVPAEPPVVAGLRVSGTFTRLPGNVGHRTSTERARPMEANVIPVAEPPAGTLAGRARELELESEGRRYYPLFDTLRAIASIAVLLFHSVNSSNAHETAWWGRFTEALNAGVPVFFALSGFLLYRPFVGARLSGRPAPNVKTYFKRRFLRIFPAYWVALITLGLLLGVQVFTSDWWKFFALAQVYDNSTVFSGLTPAWSLCVEISFYVALPLYAIGVGKLLRGRSVAQQVRTEFGVLAGLWVMAIVIRRAAAIIDAEALHWVIWSLPGHIDWFVNGMVLSLIAARPDLVGHPIRLAVAAVERFPTTVWLLAAGIFVLSAAPRSNPWDWAHMTQGLFALVFILPGVFGDDRGGLPRKFLALPAMAWLGLVSYGIFLWNEPLPPWLHKHGLDNWGFISGVVPVVLMSFAISVALAAASWYLIEKPLIGKRPRRT
jgi:peptidoglycan/LPS O-acetylase OafA/YrhL